MDYYQDITVLPDPEFNESVLLNAVYAKLHRAICQFAPSKIGVSFPAVGKTLGNTIRLHGAEASLKLLDTQKWRQGLQDYTFATELLPVPANAKFRTVKRVQAKSVHNKRKRSVAKGWLTEVQAQEKIPDNQFKVLKLPYAQLKSLSNGNIMRVYIQHGELQECPAEGEFNSYGLSPTATIPWF